MCLISMIFFILRYALRLSIDFNNGWQGLLNLILPPAQLPVNEKRGMLTFEPLV